MDIAKRMDLVVFVLIVFLFSLIGYNLVYKYGLEKINSVKAQIEEEENKNRLLETVGELNKAAGKYRQRSFSSNEISPVLDRISELAEQAGISITSFDPLAPVSRNGYTELPVRVPFSGQYHQVGKFLSLIESSRECIWVKELKLRKPRAIGSKPIILPVDLTVCGLYLEK